MESFSEYQKFCESTVVFPPSVGVEYTALGLASEAGEYAGKVKKILRGDKTLAQSKDDLVKELGDVLWYAAVASCALGISLQQVVDSNVAKLSSRKQRGELQGEGDNR